MALSERRCRRESGFTLVELLVVIVILGILAGVVVFAVRGAGDKGRPAAVATDNRIIRTALEAYCAQEGHYPIADPSGDPDAMQRLKDERFLSSRSVYHELSTGSEARQGNCGTVGTPGGRYRLDVIDEDVIPAGESIVTTPPLRGVRTQPQPNMVQLPDGRVFTGRELFDPVARTWARATPPIGAREPEEGSNPFRGGPVSDDGEAGWDNPTKPGPYRGR